MKLLSKLGEVKRPELLSRSGVIGISWATTGGEAAGKTQALGYDGALKEDVTSVLCNFTGNDFIGNFIYSLQVAALVGKACNFLKHSVSQVVNNAMNTSHFQYLIFT